MGSKTNMTREEVIKEKETIINQVKIFRAERIIKLFEIEEKIVNEIFIDYDINMTFETFKNISKEVKKHQNTKYKYGSVINILSKELGYKNYHHLIAIIRNK
ncbi:MAG: hypothetical protein QM490_01950 [Candidatus Gracilibacteria bacterium]